MRNAMRSQRAKVLGTLGVVVTMIATAGCFDFLSDPNLLLQESPTTGTGGTGGAGGTTVDPGCIPSNAAMPIDDECGVWVSSTQGLDANEGRSKTQPFQSIAKALGAATGKPIYLCGETFAEPVAIQAGARVYGGLDCTNGWVYASDKRTVIAPAADAVPLRVTSKATLEMYDVDLTAADAATPGSSSIAMLAESDTDVTLTRSKVTAGKGATGVDGAPFDMPATEGPGGKPGNDACTGDMLFGGSSVKNTCAADESVSGKGGVSDELSGGPGGPGSPGAAMNGGVGQDANNLTCTDGTVGNVGENGAAGPGATGMGSLSSAGFTGVPGSDGLPGKVGQGGGGGGGAKGGNAGNACNKVMGAAGNAGASGASGGAGGCGGAGGKGGGPGGSSIAVVSLGATLHFETVTITAGAGGRGGNGGAGQTGGTGGPGAAGGKVPAMASDLKPGCAGGAGGKGGDGGKGGGGLGGASIGLAHTGKAPATTGAQISAGTPGAGGKGDVPDNDGATGPTGKVVPF